MHRSDSSLRIGQASCLRVPLFSKEGLGEIIFLSNPPRSPFKKGGSKKGFNKGGGNGGSSIRKGGSKGNTLFACSYWSRLVNFQEDPFSLDH
jgi:hypothetical protein